MANFKQMPMSPDQLLMFPVSVDASIPQGADVRVLGEAMDLIDWSVFESGYSETGCPAYPPKVLAKILVYGYSKGIRSSRALEEAVKNDKRYVWLAGGLDPDHTTISRFRKERQAELKAAYKETVRICAEAGLVLLHVTATDGSKVQARASKSSLYDGKRLQNECEAIDRIMREAEEADAEEDARYGSGNGSAVSAELADALKRKKKLEEAASHLKQDRQKQVSVTDPECRVMKTSIGLRPAYNVQVTVDSANQVIVAADVVTNQADNGQLRSQLKQVVENTGLRPGLVLADTGYSDEQTIKALEEMGQDALMPPHQQPQEKKRKDLFASKCFLRAEGKDALTCPAGRELPYYRQVKCGSGTYREYRAFGCRDCSFYRQCVMTHCKTGRAIQVSVVAEQRQAMLDRLSTPEGKRLYALRQQTVEPTFGNIKSNMKLARFLLDGVAGASSETWLVCMAHNLKIYARRAAEAAGFFLRVLAGCRMGLPSANAGIFGGSVHPKLCCSA